MVEVSPGKEGRPGQTLALLSKTETPDTSRKPRGRAQLCRHGPWLLRTGTLGWLCPCLGRLAQPETSLSHG